MELSHQLCENHILLSAVDHPQGATGCQRMHHFICLTVLLSSLLMTTSLWYSQVHAASQHKLMTGTSIFRISDAGVAAVSALVCLVFVALILEIFRCSNRKVLRAAFCIFTLHRAGVP